MFTGYTFRDPELILAGFLHCRFNNSFFRIWFTQLSALVWLTKEYKIKWSIRIILWKVMICLTNPRHENEKMREREIFATDKVNYNNIIHDTFMYIHAYMKSAEFSVFYKIPKSTITQLQFFVCDGDGEEVKKVRIVWCCCWFTYLQMKLLYIIIGIAL